MSETATTAPAAPATAPAETTPAAPAAPTAPAAPAPTAPPTPTPTAPPAQGEPQDVASLPEWAQTLIRNTRAEAADWRTRAQGTAPQQPAQPAEPAPAAEGDVSRLPRWAQQAVTDGQGAARTLAMQTAVIAAAPAAGADVARLLDSQAAMRALSAVDPSDPDAIQQAITNTLNAHPHLAAGGTGPARGGAEFGASSGGEITPQQFAAMDYTARTDLYANDPDTYRRLAG